MNRIVKSLLTWGSIISLIYLLGGCGAAQLAMSKKDLDVQAKTSTAVFVDPVAPAKRKIYLDVKSGVMEFDRHKFKEFIKQQFVENNDNHYQIVDDPDEAQFQMIAYVLNLEKADPSAAESALHQGYMGGAIVGGAAAGALINRNHPGTGLLAGGLVAGAGEFIADSLVKDVTYMLVCDVQIKEKAAKGVIVRKDTQIDAKVSDAGTSRQSVSEASNKKEYRTRIVTTAEKVNLKLEDAQDLMFKKTAYAMAGFF
jgi:hypothetical protein